MSRKKQEVYKETEFDYFLVIGFYYNSNRKFKNKYISWRAANCINLWKGNVWGVFPNGKRIRLKSVYN